MPLTAVSSSGRVLTGASFGPVDGDPVLFIAGAGTGRAMSFGEHLLDARSVRLITMDRPGMGGSDINSTRTISSTAADYREFLTKALNDEAVTVPVVANSQGGMFGLAAAAEGWASTLVLASPADEVAHPSVGHLLAESARRLPDLVADDPVQARILLSSYTREDLLAMILSGSDPVDQAVYSDPNFAQKFAVALEQGFSNNGEGYVIDTMAAMEAWRIELKRIKIPVFVLYGEKDYTHSPDQGAILTSRIPGARRILIPEAGGALLWTHAERILDLALRCGNSNPTPR